MDTTKETPCNNHINILLLAANPKNTNSLRLDEEIREIEEGLTRSKERDNIKLTQRLAVHGRDIQRSILDVSPQIIHFSGHGSGEEGLVLEDETGKAKFVDSRALAGLFQLFNEQLDCVVLNACYSEVQAKAIAEHINYVIGMSQAIGDKAAIEFAVGFYDAIGAGKTIEFAYKFGCVAIQLAGISEENTPKLIKKSELEIIEIKVDDIPIDDDELHELQELKARLPEISDDSSQDSILDNISTTHLRWELTLEANIENQDRESIDHI